MFQASICVDVESVVEVCCEVMPLGKNIWMKITCKGGLSICV